MDSSIEATFSAAEAARDQQTAPQAATPYEPFLQDWYPASAERLDPGRISFTNRQLAIVGFLTILGMGMMAGLAYVAGRVASNGPSRVLMVESVQPAAGSKQAQLPALSPVPSAPVAAVVKPSPAMVPPAAATKTQAAVPAGSGSLPIRNSASRGLAFWQIGSLEPGMAKVSEKYLQDSGLPVQLEATPGSKQVRVLVGPADGEELTQLKFKLDGLGFQAFLKRL